MKDSRGLENKVEDTQDGSVAESMAESLDPREREDLAEFIEEEMGKQGAAPGKGRRRWPALVGVLLILVVGVLVLRLVEAPGWEGELARGLEAERAGDVGRALEIYATLDSAGRGNALWKYEYEARCLFLLGRGEAARGIYDLLYARHGNAHAEDLREAGDPGWRAWRLQDAGQTADLLEACAALLAMQESVEFRWFPRNLFEDRALYLAHTSEGWVRRYVALRALGRDAEALGTLEAYRAKYAGDLSAFREHRRAEGVRAP